MSLLVLLFLLFLVLLAGLFGIALAITSARSDEQAARAFAALARERGASL
jgi:hypothetical protein